MSINIEKRVEQYVLVRDKIKTIKDKHKAELEPFNDMLEKLGAVLLGYLNTTNQDKAGTSAGTVYRTIKKSASIADATLFWDFIVANNDFDMIDKRANTTAIEDYIKTHGTTPPGINWSTMEIVGVQRAAASK